MRGQWNRPAPGIPSRPRLTIPETGRIISESGNAWVERDRVVEACGVVGLTGTTRGDPEKRRERPAGTSPRR